MRRRLARLGDRHPLAGLHLLDAESGQWNVPQVAAEGGGTDAVLIGWALRRRGLVVRAADRLTSLEDLRGRRLITRQPGSGAELLLAHLLKQSGIGDSDITLIGPARSETDAAQAVAQGAADAALGLEAGAAQLGLSFVPIIEERFDLLLDRTAYFEPPLQAFLDFCQTQALRDQAQALGGYDMRDLGRVRWNG